MKKQIYSSLFFGLIACLSLAQQNPFKPRFQSSIKGDLVIISNQILNREEKNNDSNVPYNTIDRSSKNNDEFKMKYVDIDNDNTTFSSSAATLMLNKQNSKIVYAGLYWGATYPYDEGKLNKKQKHVTIKKERELSNIIKFKVPSSQYQEIKGELIFDGFTQEAFKESAPYVYYANVTTLLQNQNSIDGEYQVANIKAAQGIISGGSSAGWTLVVVYENELLPKKYIATYDGFAGLTTKHLDIPFQNIQTLENGIVNAAIFGAALEGDLNLKGEQIQIKANDVNDFSFIENDIRVKNNFFNSTITQNNEYIENRRPNSKNNLGYDAFYLEIANQDNTIIPNNTNSVTLRLKTSGDRCFLFLLGLNIEVLDQSKEDISIKEEVVAEKVVDKEDIIHSDEKEIKPNSSKINYSNRVNPIPSPDVVVNDTDKGFYLISGVFAIHKNAINWMKKLQEKGIQAGYFVNPKNNYRYVYIAHTEKWKDAETLYFSDVNNKYKGDLWIMTITNTQEFQNKTAYQTKEYLETKPKSKIKTKRKQFYYNYKKNIVNRKKTNQSKTV